jgi:tRNA(Ile2) C34 agmatinyltransferase TiaS
VSTALAGPSVALEAPRLLDPDELPAPARRRPTLEEAVLEAWRELRLRGSAACPVCGEATDAAGECRACGSSLT